ncbi:MAG: prevent-host-death family protein [Stigonema ocellatum SAG 48.90 = DSM 106950]|nr:prevent-host-death family protein [Stigonema ocellatum SAG 48.90 = DSM 106950]
MTIKELLLQEIDSTPAELLENVLDFLQSLKTSPKQPLATYRELKERIDYLETIVGIRKGLDEFEQGEGIPAEQALATLQHKFSNSSCSPQ